MLLPGAWGRLIQRRDEKGQTNAIAIADGQLKVSRLQVPAREGSVIVTIDGADVEATGSVDDGVRTIDLAQPLTLEPGNTLTIEQR
jgi:hypothetical protein